MAQRLPPPSHIAAIEVDPTLEQAFMDQRDLSREVRWMRLCWIGGWTPRLQLDEAPVCKAASSPQGDARACNVQGAMLGNCSHARCNSAAMHSCTEDMHQVFDRNLIA